MDGDRELVVFHQVLEADAPMHHGATVPDSWDLAPIDLHRARAAAPDVAAEEAWTRAQEELAAAAAAEELAAAAAAEQEAQH